MGSWSVITHSARQTRSYGRRMGRLMQGGEIIGLVGELGTGKTCFVTGVAEGLDVGKGTWIRSPTFTLINEYQGRLPVYHIDLYRISSRNELEGLDLREYLYSGGVSLIEWFEHLPEAEVDECLEVRLAYANGAQRELVFFPRGPRYEDIVEKMKGDKRG